MSSRASEAQHAPLLPRSHAPTIVHSRTRAAGRLDSLLAIVRFAQAGATLQRLFRELGQRNPRSVGLCAGGAPAWSAQAVEALLAAALSHAFALPSFRTRAPHEQRGLRRIVLIDAPQLDVRYASALARGGNLARWLTPLPPNVLDAVGYRRAIGQLGRAHGLSLRWLDERTLRCAGAHAFLAVAAGNEERGAGIAHLQYRPARRVRRATPDVALIGKGILFDTGGINLKTHRADAWLAITENLIGPRAYRPQQVVRVANCVTIQVIHTDAEGRTVLADTLALAGRTRRRLMIDFATLTGACVYCLTERMCGGFTNRPHLESTLRDAGRLSGERVWNFPFAEDYDADLESKVADVRQCALEGNGDHILAARFLSRFVPDATPWVHVNLSAATRSGGLAHVNTDVTGLGVRFALELLLKQDVRAALAA